MRFQNVFSSAAVVSAGSFVSRLMGLLRDVLIASLLGAGPIADALIVAFRLPNLFRKLFAEGSLSSAITATITHVEAVEGEARGLSLVRTCLLWTVGLLSVFLMVAEYGSSVLVTVLAPGLMVTPDVFQYANSLLQLTLPYLLCIGLVAFFSGVLHSKNSFTAPALAPLVLNCSLIIGAGVAWIWALPVAETLCIFLVLGGMLQVVLQAAFLPKGMFVYGSWRIFDSEAYLLGKRLIPTILSGAVFQLSVLLVTVLASFQTEGTIAKLYFADRLVQFPLGLIGVAIGIAVLPALSSLAASNDVQKFGELLSSAMQFTFFLALPATAGLWVLAHPILQVFFERGAFSPADAAVAATMLQAFTVGLPAFAVSRPLLSAYYARQKNRVPVLAGGSSLVVTVVLGALFMPFWGGVGLAFAVACGGWVNCGMLYFLLNRHQLGSVRLHRWNLMYLVASVAVGGGCKLVAPYGVVSLYSIPLFAAGYLICLYLGNSPDAQQLFALIARRRGTNQL